MPTESIVVGIDRGDHTERVTVEADHIDRDRDGTVRCYDDDTEIGTFWNAEYAVRADNLED